MFKFAYTLGCWEALMKLGAPIDLTPEQRKLLTEGRKHLRDVLTPEQLQQTQQLTRPGPRHAPISQPAQNYMRRLTETNAPTAPLTPQLQQAQRQWRHVAQRQIPEFIVAGGGYELPGGGLTDEGTMRSWAQQRKMRPWLESKGQQIAMAPTVAPTSAVATAARTPVAPEFADTALNIVARKPPRGTAVAKTLLRRFAHI